MTTEDDVVEIADGVEIVDGGWALLVRLVGCRVEEEETGTDERGAEETKLLIRWNDFHSNSSNSTKAHKKN